MSTDIFSPATDALNPSTGDLSKPMVSFDSSAENAFDAWVQSADLRSSYEGWSFMNLPTNYDGQVRFAIMHSAPKTLVRSLQIAMLTEK
jgi:hypothetical protein